MSDQMYNEVIEKFKTQTIRHFNVKNEHCVDEYGDPDYSAMTIDSADWDDGSDLTPEELEFLNTDAKEVWEDLVNGRINGDF